MKERSPAEHGVDVFTRYLHVLDEGGEPDDALLEDVWQGLRQRLRRVLEERGMWQRSPRLLGIVGWDRWQEGEGRGAQRYDALRELTADAYGFVLVDRLGSLLSQLQHKPQIEGLVIRSVRNFVHERQTRHDPIGRRVFTVLDRALTAAIESGDLYLSASDEKLRTGSLLSFSAPPWDADDVRESRVDSDRVEAWVARWNDQLLPALVTATGSGYPRLIAEVQRLIHDLPAAKVRFFRPRDIMRPMARDARQRWRTIREDVLSMTTSETRTFEAREQFEALAGRVEQMVRDSDENPDRRRLMLSIWQLLVTWSDERAQPLGFDDLDQADTPSQRAVARALDVSRDRVATAFRKLGVIVRTSRSQLASRRGPQRDAAGLTLPTGVSTGTHSANLEDRLRRRTLEAAARARHERSAIGLEDRRAGDVFVAPAFAGLCEWVVLEIDQSAGTVLVVPADTSSLVGARDVVVHADEPGGPLTVRCSLARWIDRASLAELPSRRLAADTVDVARGRVTAAAGEQDAAAYDTPKEEVDTDHRDWLIRLQAAAASLDNTDR